MPLVPLPRCCESHSDWTVLTEHLIEQFPSLQADDVLREVASAKLAAAGFGLDEAELFEVAELMARYQLLLASGDVQDAARLDPERHSRRSSTT